MFANLFPKIALLALTAGGLSLYPGASADAASPGFVSLHGYAAHGKNQLRLGRADAAQPLSVVVALKPRNEAGLKALIRAMHDPSSPQFGHYLTPAQFSDQFSPSAADYDAVAEHFEGQGLTVSRRSSRMILKVTGTTSNMAKALGVSFSRFSGKDGEFVSADDDPQLPSGVAGHVAALVGLRTNVRLKPSFVRSSVAHAVPSAASGPAGGFSPQDIRKAYNIPPLLGGAGETIGLVELDGYDPADIKAYARKFGLPPLKLQDVFIDGFPGGSVDPFSGQVEVTLDLEMVQAVAPLASKVQVYQGYNDLPTVLDIYDRIVTDDTAKEISTSWGNPEDLLLDTPGGADFLRAENYLFEEAAAQGQSVFAASADRGAFDDGTMPTTPVVDDPAAQPYVIGVGGTTLHTGAFGQWSGENTWNDLATTGNATGGGVSRFWPITPTQLPAATGVPGASTAYRNVPDVSLNADPTPGYSVYQASNASMTPAGDGWFTSGGTSASAPLWAAFMATVNSDRRALGLKRLGWPAPALYSLYKTPLYGIFFHDIADGGNNGFYTTQTGYDLTTGLGSINGIGLTAGLLLSPPATVTVGAEPTTPVLVAQGGDTKDFLSWSAVPHATAYKVYRSVGSDPALHFLATVTANQYTDTGLTDDTTYNYAVAAVGSWGVGSLSATQSATPTALFFELPPIDGFASPGVLQIFWISSTNGSNTVTWGYSPTALNHTLVCQFGNGGFITLTGLTPNVPVYFNVAVDAGNGVLNSGVQEATP